MGFRLSLFLLSLIFFGAFTYFSYTVAKEMWQQTDFDTTVKLQDHISRKFDLYFSYFSILGSAEVTIGVALILAFLSLIKWKLSAFLGWLIIFPASFFEVFGKLVVFHPSPPELFHRNILLSKLPSFYVHTNFSYPSGHMTRTVFLLSVILLMILFSRKTASFKLFSTVLIIGFGFMMTLTRVYLGEHWLSDVIGGGLLGAGAGLFASIFILGKKYVRIG